MSSALVLESFSSSAEDNASAEAYIAALDLPTRTSRLRLDGDGQLVDGKISFSDLDAVYVVVAREAAPLASPLVSSVVAGLTAGAKYTHWEALPASAEPGKRSVATVSLELMVAGLTGISALTAADDTVTITADKPKWSTGEAAPLKKRRARKTAEVEEAKRAWKLAAEEDDEGDDLADEDALLDGDVVEVTNGGDCSTRRRACKDCSCGRAESEASGVPVMTDEELAKSISSCGNCYKGDAFRCGSCPFLGKPAFKPGEGGAIKLDLSADDF